MPIDFPNSPTTNQEYTSGSKTWYWTGSKWKIKSQTLGTGAFATIENYALLSGATFTVSSGSTIPLTIQNNGTGNSFVVNDVASDTTPFVIDQSGNVGIGTSTPLADLHIGSTITTSDFRMSNSVSSTVLNMYTSSNDIVIHNATATGLLHLGTNSTNRLSINSSGVVTFSNNTVHSGSTSGSITIATPAVAGTNTLTLPTSTGTFSTEDVAWYFGLIL